MNCPKLIQGQDWIETSKWPVQIQRDLYPQLTLPLTGAYAFLSGLQLLGYYLDEQLVICRGYTCDGYSPVVKICGKYLRFTPTPSCGIFPAVVHDFMRQFAFVPGAPWDRFDADDEFWNALVAGKCNGIAGIYHHAVAGPVGTLYIKLTRSVDPKLSILHAINDERQIRSMVQQQKLQTFQPS